MFRTCLFLILISILASCTSTPPQTIAPPIVSTNSAQEPTIPKTTEPALAEATLTAEPASVAIQEYPVPRGLIRMMSRPLQMGASGTLPKTQGRWASSTQKLGKRVTFR